MTLPMKTAISLYPKGKVIFSGQYDGHLAKGDHITIQDDYRVVKVTHFPVHNYRIVRVVLKDEYEEA